MYLSFDKKLFTVSHIDVIMQCLLQPLHCFFNPYLNSENNFIQMETQRLNPFLLPHKGLRNLLSKVSFLAGNLDCTSVHEIEQLKIFAGELFYFLEQHAHVEDTIVLPELECKSPGSTHENHEDHEVLEAIVAKLVRQVEKLSLESTPTDFLDFFMEISDFHSKYLAHMLMEEREVLKAIWANFTDEELIAQHHRIVSSITPEKILRWYRFIVPALNPQERKMVLGGMKAKAPEAFFNELMEVVKAELSEFAFSNLVKSLEEKELASN